MKEQNEIIKNQNKTISDINNELTNLKDCLNSICNQNGQILLNKNEASPTVIIDKPYIEQNNPNPFNQKSLIRYYLPQNTKAKIEIYSMDGRFIKSFGELKIGNNNIEVDANSLSHGSYIYHLIANDKAVDSKLMTVTK